MEFSHNELYLFYYTYRRDDEVLLGLSLNLALAISSLLAHGGSAIILLIVLYRALVEAAREPLLFRRSP